jgi:hypothetical protein
MLQSAFVFFVMAGLRPGHPRLSEFSQDVDARDKPGHDEICGKATQGGLALA